MIQHQVTLIPQTSEWSCWAAGIAMILSWRDHASFDPRLIAENFGGKSYLNAYQTGLDPNDTYILNRYGLSVEAPQSYLPSGWSRMLQQHGPLWVASAVPGPHIRVVTGIALGDNAETTTLYINDPWPPNSGARYSKHLSEFIRDYEQLATEELSQPAPVYVAHLP